MVLLDMRPDELVGVMAVTLGICVIALPSAVFGIARKWSDAQPELGGSILAGAVTICIASIAVGGAIVLASLGWLPPPNEW